MTEKKSIWEEFEFGKFKNTPYKLLREFEKGLVESTQGELEAETIYSSANGKMKLTFYVVATNLGNYRKALIDVNYELEGFPVNIHSRLTNNDYNVNEENFKTTVETILLHPKVKDVIVHLYQISKDNKS